MLRIASVALLVFALTACKQATNATPSTGEHASAAPAAAAPMTTDKHEGQPFTNAPEIEIAALVANPTGYTGKTVRLSGDVIAMCHHKRDWFALVPKDSQGQNVRVLTGPVFRVPEDAIGRSASAEGTVDVVEISERVARHFAESHNLGDAATINGPIQQVVVRATGARFN